MKLQWETDQEHLACRWSEIGSRVAYKADWLQNATKYLDQPRTASPIVDFARLSPFGRGEWYEAKAD